MSLIPADRLYSRYGSVLVTGPAVEPVTVDDMVDLLGLDYSGGNSVIIGEMITQARQEIEDATGLAMISQTWRLSLDSWPGAEDWWDGVRDGAISAIRRPSASSAVTLPRWPLSSIASVTTYDEDGAASAVTVADVFDVDTWQRPGRLALRAGKTWPVALRETNAIDIQYVAGFGAAKTDVPAPIKRAVRTLAAYLFSHRGDNCDTGDALAKSGAGALIGRYRVARI